MYPEVTTVSPGGLTSQVRLNTTSEEVWTTSLNCTTTTFVSVPPPPGRSCEKIEIKVSLVRVELPRSDDARVQDHRPGLADGAGEVVAEVEAGLDELAELDHHDVGRSVAELICSIFKRGHATGRLAKN